MLKFSAVFGGIVINAAWNAMQPTPNSTQDFGSIETALAQVRSYNAANPATPLGAKLRVYEGQ